MSSTRPFLVPAALGIVWLAWLAGSPAAFAQPPDAEMVEEVTPDDVPESVPDTAASIAPPSSDQIAEVPLLEYAVVWQAWELRGPIPPVELSVLRSFFAPEMKRHTSINGEARRALREYAKKIGFHLTAITANAAGEKLVAVLHIEPATWIRKVNVHLRRPEWYHALMFWSAVYSEEIARRMSLKAGSQLSVDIKKDLRLESLRVETYLQSQGYFDACVEIRCSSGVKTPDILQPKCDQTPRDLNLDLCVGTVELEVDVHAGDRYEFGEVSVTGNQAFDQDKLTAPFRASCLKLLSWTPCLPNRFSLPSLKSRLEKVVRMYKNKNYPAVRVRTDFDPASIFREGDKKVDFNLIVNERRKIEVIFEGRYPPLLTQEKLQSLLTFNDEGSFDDVEVAASAEAIRLYLQSNGFFEANVTYERERFSFLDNIVFTLDAGARLKVERISLFGHQGQTVKDLTRVIKTRRGRYISAGQLEADVARLESHYQKLGYEDVEVSVRVSRSADNDANAAVLAALVASGAYRRGLYVTFEIAEGQRSMIDNVRFEFQGEHTFTEKELQKVVSVAPGDPFYSSNIDRGHDELERFYFKKAHPQATIKSETPASGKPGHYDVVYKVTEHHKVRIGKVLVQGNFKTAEWVILDELGFREGMELSLDRAEIGGQNLRATGLFSAVQVTFLHLENPKEQDINVLVRVQERHDYNVAGEGALGIATDREAFVEGALTMPNLLGNGLRLDLRLRFGTRFSSAEGTFTIPRWVMRRTTKKLTGGHLPLSVSVESAAFWRREQTERFGDLTSIGANTAVSKLFRRGLWRGLLLSLRYDFRQRNREEALVRSAGSSEDLQTAPVKTLTGALSPQISLDRRRDRRGRPNPLTPESGYKIDLRALWATPYLGGQDNFLKFSVSGQHFWKPSSRILITNSIRYDHGVPRSDVVLPEVERYFAGGDTTIRGFEEDRLATEIIEEPLPPFGTVSQLRVLPAGGNIRLIHNFDIQIDVWELFGAPVASGVFLDTGLVKNSLEGVQPEDLRHSLGIAFARFVQPFGSLSLEWAVPLDPQTGDNPRGRFHFNFGLLF